MKTCKYCGEKFKSDEEICPDCIVNNLINDHFNKNNVKTTIIYLNKRD